MLELINPHVTKILLTVKNGDSIRGVSKKIGSSYGWTYKWVKQLEEVGILNRSKQGLRVEDRELAGKFKNLARSVLKKELELKDAYLLPNFSGLKYAYDKIDSVFIWTKGGYQIGRSRKSYPIFIRVLKEDLEEWKEFFDEYSISYSIGERKEKGGIYFVLFPEEEFETEQVKGSSVIPLEETVQWAQEYKYNFQPALEMLDEMYDLDLEVSYR